MSEHSAPRIKVVPTPTNEPQALIPMPPDVREYVIAKLAEILVLDYQQYQSAPELTVVEGSGCNRNLRLVSSKKRAG